MKSLIYSPGHRIGTINICLGVSSSGPFWLKIPWTSSCSNLLPVWLQTRYQEHFKFIEIFSSHTGEQQVSGAHAQPPHPFTLFSSVFVPSETFFPTLPPLGWMKWGSLLERGCGLVGGWFVRERKIGGLVWTECIEQKGKKLGK